ncbi:MAG: hypothetical protein WC381_10485 [Kiritimatiellia bacterium]
MRPDLIKAVLGGQAGLDDCKEAMSEALRGIMVKALADQMQFGSGDALRAILSSGARGSASTGG